MKQNFLMFFLGALAMGAVLALVSSASNNSPQSSSSNEMYNINNENNTSESYELNSPEVVQAEVQFVQSDVQNWEIDNNLEIISVDTGESGVQYWDINDDLELVSTDADETGVKSLILAKSEFLQ
ncbi:MAG: hypothetical protein ISS16_12175 [Ignavibacteria bacterium]|nr:hypothetical protein [Ignavibacteria bacterium]